jgi:hypothetical protein
VAYEPNKLLSRLVGCNLATVVFLRWYLQLTFDGPILTCEVWPTVDLGDGEIHYGKPGYRDALCSLLGETVVATREETGLGLALQFATGGIRVHPAREQVDGSRDRDALWLRRSFVDGVAAGRGVVRRPRLTSTGQVRIFNHY